MVFSRGTLLNKESTSKDAINKPASCSQIIFANSEESFKANSLEVRCRNKGTKNFPSKMLIAFICCYWIHLADCKFSRLLINFCKLMCG